jgi:uncharacterized MnhB-related membrane protein
MILKIVAIIIALAIITMAIVAVQNRKLIVAIIAAGVVSLFASVFYLLMAAPDVAMTEAAIGSGLSTIIFFYVLNKIKKDRLDNV